MMSHITSIRLKNSLKIYISTWLNDRYRLSRSTRHPYQIVSFANIPMLGISI